MEIEQQTNEQNRREALASAESVYGAIDEALEELRAQVGAALSGPTPDRSKAYQRSLELKLLEGAQQYFARRAEQLSFSDRPAKVS